MNTYRMHLEGWIKVCTYLLLGCIALLVEKTASARPRFDSSTDMGLVLVPADAEIDSVIFRLRATDQDADFPLIFDITATVTPVVRIENLPCTLYNKVCQANVILTRRLIPGRLHDFAVRVKDSKGDSNSMQATISVTNATTQRDKIFPHIPAIIMVPEDTKPGKELDYILVRSNQWSGKPVYIELWQPKELFTIRQRQTPAETRGVITLIGELDFETQSMYTLTIYATDPYTEPRKDTRNIAGLHLVVVVQDVQDVPPIFTLAPPLTKINNTVKPGDVILRVHAEDGDKGVPREVTYGLVSEHNPFTPFFNISETTGEIILARPLEELTQITHVGAPVVLTVVAEEIRRSTSEPPAQATVVEVGLLLGEPGNSPPFFENDNYVAWMDENAEPGSVVTFTEHYSTKVRDEDIGKAGVFALKLENNNGTFEISPTVAERTANFIITVRDNSFMDYELHKNLRFKIIAQEVGPATNLSAEVPVTIFLRDVNDNVPEFEVPSYEVTLSENATAGTRVIQVHATDKDTGSFGRIQYTRIIGTGSEAFDIDPDTGIITVSMKTSALDREITASLQLSVEARDEDGKGLRGTVPLIVNLLDVNDNAPIFEKDSYKFTLNEDLTNFTTAAIIKAFDADAEPPNNEVRYEIIHGNYDNKFYLNEITGELFLREPINKIRRTRHNPYQSFAKIFRSGLVKVQKTFEIMLSSSTISPDVTESPETATGENKNSNETSDVTEKPVKEPLRIRKKRADDEVLFTLTARAYDLGVPHLSGVTQVSISRSPIAGARIVMFVVSGENPDPVKTAETLTAITGGRITVLETRPYTSADIPSGSGMNVPSLEGVKKSIVVARVEPNSGRTSLVDIEKIRAALAANGVGVIDGDMPDGTMKPGTNHNTNINSTTGVTSEEVTIYKAENRLLFWLLIILGLLMLIALIALIICCICPGCPFYMAPRKRRVHSSETLIARSDARPRRHLHRKHTRLLDGHWSGKKQAWSADPMRRNWQFNRRNQKAGGQASLPGDVHIIDRDHEITEKAASLRLREGPVPMYLTDPTRRPDEERIYIEDVEGLRTRDYGVVDMEALRQHDIERGSDMTHRTYVNEDEQRAHEQTKFVREQHFYRDGNAEVLRLVTRGQIEEGMISHPLHRPQTLVIDQGQSGAYRVDGKDILLQRFIEDQKIRHASDGGQDLHDSMQDIERRSMESHHRQKEAIFIQHQQQQPQQHQQKVLLIPERLEEDHRQHMEELGPGVQRLIIDHGTFEKTARFEPKDSQEMIPGATLLMHSSMSKSLGEKAKEQTSRQSINVQHYSIHDLELARQNALLTRLLLERDGREVGGGAMVDSASYLETQSLPGQVAIATQTDRTAATQTELPNKSRSDNDESEEEARMRKKMKSKKRHGDGEPRRIRTLWMKSPIHEEDIHCCSGKRTNVLRKKMRDIKDSRRISLEPEVLQAISDSLDENGEAPITARRRDLQQEDSNSREESRNEEEHSRLEDSSSMEFTHRDGRSIVPGKREDRSVNDDENKKKSHRGKRENTVEPSFRILEREMSSLSKKLSKLTGRKILQYTNGSETDSQEKIKTVAVDSRKVDKKPVVVDKTQVTEIKKVTKGIEITKTKRSNSSTRALVPDVSSGKEQTKIREEVIGDPKTRHLSKYRKNQAISTGSSDFEDTVEKTKKQIPSATHLEKQKQVATKISHTKLKRQNKVEHKDLAKTGPLLLPPETVEQKDSSDTASKGSTKSGRSERDSMRMMKYGSGTSGVKTLSSGSPSSDNSKNTKAKKKGKSTVGAGKKSSAGTIESSSKLSHDEAVTPDKSDEKNSLESTVIEIEAKSSTVSELTMKVVPEETQKSVNIPTPNLQATEMKLKIGPETVTSKIVQTPILTPEVSEMTMEILLESVDTKKIEKLLTPTLIPEVPELSMTILPESLTTKTVQTPALSPKVPDLSMKIVAGTTEIEKSEELPMPEIEKRSDEASERASIASPKTSEDIALTESFDSIKDQVLTMPKEELMDFLSHEMKDSIQSLQAHEHSLTEGIGKIKDVVLGSVTMGSMEKDTVDTHKKEELSKPAKLKTSDNFEEWEEITSDTVKDTEFPTQKEETVVAQQSEDAGMFSDNFDSFCGTDMHPKDSLENRESEIPYETFQSESSEDQITEKLGTNIKDVELQDYVTETPDKSEKTITSPITIISREAEIEASEKSSTKLLPTSQTPDKSPDSIKETISRIPTPMPSELMAKETDIEIASPDLIDISATKTDITIPFRESQNIPEPTESPKVTEPASPSEESYTDKLPEISPLEIVIPTSITEPIISPTVKEIVSPKEEADTDNVSKIPPLDITLSPEEKIVILGEPTEAKLSKPEILIASPTLQSRSPEEMTLETLSPKEFGIADSLFVDAKLLKVSPRLERKIVSDIKVEESPAEKSNDIQKTIDVDVPPVNLVELSRVMLDDDADDSDSSEASSKTMLTARPYGTPRHRPISSGTNADEMLETSEAKPVDLQSTVDLPAKDLSIGISQVTPEAGEMMKSVEKPEDEALPDKPDERSQNKSPEIETKTRPSSSRKQEIIVSEREVSPTVSSTITSEDTEGDVKILERKDPETTQSSEGENKVLERTSPPDEDLKADTSEKVQLYQIGQEKLPAADDDGFASLPEMEEPMKSLDVSKVPEEVIQLPTEIRKRAVIAKIVKVPPTGAKTGTSVGKETKKVTKKRELSREDVPRGAKKGVVQPKTASPKRDIKTKTLKEESSKIGKQSMVAGQFARSREIKRQARVVDSQMEEQSEQFSRTETVRRTWKKNERLEKDVPQQDKIKSDKVKKTSSSSDAEKIANKRPSEIRAKQDKLKDSRGKKIQEKPGKIDKSKKSVSEAKVEQTVKAGQVQEIEDQERVEKSQDEGKNDDEVAVDFPNEEKPSTTGGNTMESTIPSPVLTTPKNEEDEIKSSEAAPFPDQHTEDLVETKTELDNLADEIEETKAADPLHKTGSTESVTEEKIESKVPGEPDKTQEMPMSSEQNTETTESDQVSKDPPIQSESTEHQDPSTKEITPAEEETKSLTDTSEKSLPPELTSEKTSTPRKATKPRRETEMVVIESQSRYMEWYKQKREEMERKRRERKDTDEEEERPKWLRKSTRQRWFKGGPDDKRIFDPKIGETVPRRRKIKPLVNVESEQLKAIVRQGRKLRKAQGDKDDEPQIVIFAPEKPATPLSSIPSNSRYNHHHHLVQHSEYSYEKMPIAPFYLHPPPVPHPSPQISPQSYNEPCPEQYPLPTDARCSTESFDPGIIVQQGGTKLRHQQLLEKKSVFDIAYSEAAPSHLRADSTTPPS